jgi:uncharacterized protein (TIGR02145 family)
VNDAEIYSEIYDGNWVNGERSGSGKLEFNFAQRRIQYEGQWKNNKKDGAGEMHTVEGMGALTHCKGTWVNDELTGYAECKETFYNPETDKEESRILKGQYASDLMTGQGTEISAEGTYVGEWKDGSRSGIGKMTYKNGRIYEGNWANGMPNGDGKMKYANGTLKSGKFIDGEFAMLTDIDGNIYSTVKIGSQLWMAENLRVTRYSNGEQIPTTIPINKDFYKDNSKIVKYQWVYNGQPENAVKYGRLYTWFVVSDSRKICPLGWHVPSRDEWWQMIKELGGSQNAKFKMLRDNTGSVFNADYSGYRSTGGTFMEAGHFAKWWTSDDFKNADYVWNTDKEYNAPDINLSDNSSIIWQTFNSYTGLTFFGSGKKEGLSVRCIKD